MQWYISFFSPPHPYMLAFQYVIEAHTPPRQFTTSAPQARTFLQIVYSRLSGCLCYLSDRSVRPHRHFQLFVGQECPTTQTFLVRGNSGSMALPFALAAAEYSQSVVQR